MAKLPVDAPIRKVIKTFESLGFAIVSEGNHIAMIPLHYRKALVPRQTMHHRYPANRS